MKYLLILLALVAVHGCSPRLVGTWQITRYEEVNPGGQTSTFTNAGFITLQKNNTGTSRVSFAGPQGTVQDSSTFTWTAQDGFVTIQRTSSHNAKTWIVTEDKKNRQQWSTTDGGQKAILMELTRVKTK